MTQNNHRTYLCRHGQQRLTADNFYPRGTVNYAGAVVKNLARLVIVTAVCPDFCAVHRPTPIGDPPCCGTTTFVMNTPGGRRQTVGPIARSISPEDIPLIAICPWFISAPWLRMSNWPWPMFLIIPCW
jgi:hypothetical protein